MSDDRADDPTQSEPKDGESEASGDDAPADDWFERALRDAEDAGEDLFSGEWAPDGHDEAVVDPDATERTETAERGADDLASAFADMTDEVGDDPDAGFDDVPKTGDPTSDDESSDEQDDDGELFDTDFASALGDAPDIPGDSQPASSSPGGSTPGGSTGSGGFGDGSPALGEFGEGGGEFDMATDDFGALGDLGDVGAPGSGADFEQQDEGYESDIPRIELGVEGLDAMIQGGVPARSLMVAIGSAGTGKTTLGLQFLDRGLQQGERAVYITLEESRSRVIRSATEKGFAFDEYAEEGQLAVVDIDPVEMANSLQSIRSELPRLISDFGASRLVLDSVSLLEMMYDDRAVRRNEIYDFTRSLKDAGVTTLLTSEASEDSAFASRHGIVEYLTDAVFVLQYVRPSDFRETRLAIEIQKIRDANHSRETKPYEITNDGINVYRQANIF